MQRRHRIGGNASTVKQRLPIERLSINNATFRPFLVYSLVALIYFCLCFPTSKLIAYFERRMSHGDKR